MRRDLAAVLAKGGANGGLGQREAHAVREEEEEEKKKKKDDDDDDDDDDDGAAVEDEPRAKKPKCDFM